jgi:rhodanese-related sulfurtransferase
VEQYLIFLQKSPLNMLLLGVALISGGMLLWPFLGRVFRPTNDVGAFDAVQMINRRDAVLVDVRDAAEFAGGHITNARHIPEAQIAQRLKELEKVKSKPIIVTCRSGGRSAAVTSLLRKSGFDEVYALRGGIAAWQQAGMPLEK